MSPFVYLIAGAAATLVDASPSIRTSDGNVVISGTDLRFSETNSSISPISLVDRKRISSVPVTIFVVINHGHQTYPTCPHQTIKQAGSGHI